MRVFDRITMGKATLVASTATYAEWSSRMFKKGLTLLAAAGLVCASMASAQAGQGKIACYLWADQPSPVIGTPYTPDPAYSFNANKKGISVTKVSTGVYMVTCAGQANGSGGHVQVSAYGSGSNIACHVGEWFPSGPDLSIEVDCFGKGGGTGGGPAPADSPFDLLFVR
jgi:hypothetical protein